MLELPLGMTEARQQVALRETAWGTFAHYIPTNPQDVLILGHCYPWPDGSRTVTQLGGHAQAYVQRWKPFADAHHLILLAPAFGSGDFQGYRELHGTRIPADAFVTSLAETYGRTLINGFEDRWFLYGHSAGAQFANRYSVVHPQRLKGVVLSAPGRYAYPDTTVPWPFGMGANGCSPQAPRSGKANQEVDGLRDQPYRPDPQGWLRAATQVRIMIVIGSEDTAICSPQPGHGAGTRIEYAKKWVQMMNALAEANGATGRVRLNIVEGVGHDPIRLTGPAQTALLSP